MEKFFKRKFREDQLSTHQPSSSKNFYLEVDLKDLPADPGQRPKILDYHPNRRDEIRRVYLQKGPCQPREHNFPQKKHGKVSRRFNSSWFDEFGNWLEYSISKDAVYCLCCYLMRPEVGEQGGGDAFITEGFSNWKKKERLLVHVGGPNSFHNEAWRKCEALMNQKQHIEVVIATQSDQAKRDYRIHLTVTIDCVRFLLCQGLAFRDHDETQDSTNQGNFLKLLHFLADHNEPIERILKGARGNLKLIAPSIQKDIVNAAASLTTNAIINDLGDDLFAVLIDESRNISIKEQMTIALRYVNEKGCVVECFLSFVHIPSTNALSLKEALESKFAKYGLSLSRLRGQCYDRASNMQGEFNGLKSLILKENRSAFYVHYFAHQLQLALIVVAKNQVEIALLFNLITSLCNVVGASCKRRDILQEKQIRKIKEALEMGEIPSGRGLNQETTLKRAGDTRWGSHYGTLVNLIVMFSSVIDILEIIEEDGTSLEQRGESCALLSSIQTFEFVFNLHLMKTILGVTNELSQALQRKDQDIVNAMTLVKVAKRRLQLMRDDGWSSLLEEVCLFCEKNNITVVKVDEIFVPQGRSRSRVEQVTNLHRFQVQLFYQVIDMQLQELHKVKYGISPLYSMLEPSRFICCFQ